MQEHLIHEESTGVLVRGMRGAHIVSRSLTSSALSFVSLIIIPCVFNSVPISCRSRSKSKRKSKASKSKSKSKAKQANEGGRSQNRSRLLVRTRVRPSCRREEGKAAPPGRGRRKLVQLGATLLSC